MHWVGRRLKDRYEIQKSLNGGGMADVFVVIDWNLSDPEDPDDQLCKMIVKMPRVDDKSYIPRFRREISIQRRLADSGLAIVCVRDQGEYEGRPFGVLDYKSRGSLQDANNIGLRHPNEVARWLPRLAEALDNLHDLRHIHRDVKPGNILFDGRGEVWLSDFGLAKSIDPMASAFTNASGLCGTLPYMAPEVLRSKHESPRSDQYALGVTVFEVLCGKRPYEVANDSREIPFLHVYEPGFGLEVSHIIAKAMANAPHDRFDSCAAFTRALVPALRELASVRSPQAQVSSDKRTYTPPTVPPGRAETPNFRGVGATPLSPAEIQQEQMAPNDRLFAANEARLAETEPPRAPDNPAGIPFPKMPRLDGNLPRNDMLSPVAPHNSLAPPIEDHHAPPSPQGIPLLRINPSPEFANGASPSRPSKQKLNEMPPASEMPFGPWSRIKGNPQGAVALALGVIVLVAIIVGFLSSPEEANKADRSWPPTPDPIVTYGSDRFRPPPDNVTTVPPPPEVPFDTPEIPRMFPVAFAAAGRPFQIGASEVTNRQFKEFVKSTGYETDAERSDTKNENPGWDGKEFVRGERFSWKNTGLPGVSADDGNPVVNVSWNDAVAYCNWLSRSQKKDEAYRLVGSAWELKSGSNGFRLPTEAEWEQAAREYSKDEGKPNYGDEAYYLATDDEDASSTSGNDSTAFLSEVGLNLTHPVNFCGNVHEWCQDAFSPQLGSTTSGVGPARTCRGGGWGSPLSDCKIESRVNKNPGKGDLFTGFRVARSDS